MTSEKKRRGRPRKPPELTCKNQVKCGLNDMQSELYTRARGVHAAQTGNGCAKNTNTQLLEKGMIQILRESGDEADIRFLEDFGYVPITQPSLELEGGEMFNTVKKLFRMESGKVVNLIDVKSRKRFRYQKISTG